MEILGKIIFSIGVAVSSFFGFNEKAIAPTEPTSFGSFSPVQASQFTLSGAGISSSATTIQLNSFTLPDPARTPITMSMFGAIGYAVIEPQTSKIEVITFTGVTQNANGTAVLTGVTRGINFVAPYTASASRALSHSGGSYLILSNPAAFYGQQFALVNDDATITGVWRFNSYLPETSITATSSNQFTNKAYVDATANQGAATSTESNGGIVELGTLAEQASSYDGGVDKPTVLQTKNSTSTCQVVGSYNIVASTTTGKLDKGCFDQTANYTLTGFNMFNSSTSLTATTTIAGSNALSRALIINNVPYAFPNAQGSATTTLTNNGSGTLSWSAIPQQYTYASTSSAVVGANIVLTSNTIGIPAGTLTASSSINFKGNYACVSGGSSANNCVLEVIDNSGNVYATYTTTGTLSRTQSFDYDITILSNNSVSAQKSVFKGFLYETGGTLSLTSISVGATTSFDWTVARTFGLRFTTTAGASNTGTLNPYSIIVNP